jgi:AAA+ ATPase superfamily predicted ATPase
MIEKPDDILDRQAEWAELVDLVGSDSAELVFMHGRRRVGKSWMLQRFARAAGAIYYQATRGTAPQQINELTEVVAEYFDDVALQSGAQLSEWTDLFRYIGDKVDGDGTILIIDEFPYLLDDSPELTSVLQAQWDQQWKDSGFKLLLCGSHIKMMKQLEEHDQPLHGRRTARLKVSPFIYRDLESIVPNYDTQDLFRTYGIFGGVPGHLDHLDPQASLRENVGRLMLRPSRRLYDEARHILDGFGKSADVHYSTLFTIATGAHTWGEIKGNVDRSGGSLRPVIEWLEDLELIEREVPVTKDQPHKTKVSQYRITDPYLRFWYRFIQPIYSSGSVGMASPEALWRKRIEPGLDDYMGSVFEDVCRDFARHLLDLPLEPVRVGRWWTRKSDEEVDILVRGVDDELFVGECKWGTVTGKDLQKLKQRGRKIAEEIGNVPEIHHGLFSGRDDKTDGIEEAEADGEVTYFAGGDLFESQTL